MIKRFATMAGMVAVVGLASLAGADEPAPTIKEAMAKLHKGSTAALPSIKKALASETPDWEGIGKTAKVISSVSAGITELKPPKGDQTGYTKLVKAYTATADDLCEAVEQKDLAAAKAAVGKLQMSCMPCHSAHKGK